MMQKYNNQGIERIAKANRSLMTRVKVWSMSAKHGSNRSTNSRVDKNPRALCLEHIARLQNLTTDHFRGSHRERFVARFEREREDALERVWRNYQKLSAYVDKEYLSEGAQENTGVLTEGMAARPSFAQAILEHHIVRSNNEGNVANGTYHRNLKPSDCVSIDCAMIGGMVAELEAVGWWAINHAETRDEYLRFCKVDPVVGGRRVATLGKRTTLPNDNQPNPVRDRSGYDVNINAGRVTVGYMNANGEPVKFVKPKRGKAMDKENDFPLYDIETAVAEMDRDANADLLKQGRSYVRMSDRDFTDRINSLAAHGEAIIEEEERERP